MNIKDKYIALGIEALRKKDKEDIESRLEENIRERIAQTVLDSLTEEDQEYLKEIIELGDSEDVFIFLDTKIPDMERLVRKIAAASVGDLRELKTAM